MEILGEVRVKEERRWEKGWMHKSGSTNKQTSEGFQRNTRSMWPQALFEANTRNIFVCLSGLDFLFSLNI